MKKEWEKYSLPLSWNVMNPPWDNIDDYAHLIRLPDTLMERLVNILSPLAKEAIKSGPQFTPFEAPTTLNTYIPLQESLNEVQKTFDQISFSFNNIIKNSISDKTLHLQATKIKWGLGYCPNENVYWDYDLTINDSIYLAHEFGHKVGNSFGPSKSRLNVTEWQSHFIQNAHLERIILENTSGSSLPDIAYIHRNQEMHHNLTLFQDSLEALEKIKNKDFSPQENLSSLYTRAERMHFHATAMFIGFAMYQKFKTADKDTRQSMLHALYYQGKEATPDNILKAFDLHDKGKLEETITNGLQEIGFDPSKKMAPKLKLRPQRAP